MPQTVIELGQKVKQKYPGQYDDLSDDELGRRIKSKYPGSYDDYGDVEKPSLKSLIPPAKPVEATYGMRLKEGLKEFGKAVMNPFAGEQVVAGEPPAVDIAAPGLSMASGLKTLLRESPLGRLIPSASRAGEKFQGIMEAAKDVRPNLTEANQIAERAQQLGRAGNTIPKVLKDYIKSQEPITAKFGGQRVQMAKDPLTYGPQSDLPGTFDLASKAKKLSSIETQTIGKTPMEAQVARFAKALHEANRGAAEQVGLGHLYDQAMQEYRQAKGLTSALAIARKWTARAAVGTGLTGLGYELWKSH